MGRHGTGVWVGVVLFSADAAWAQPQSDEALLRQCYTLRQQGQHEAALERCTRAVAVARSGRSVAQLAITEFALQRWAAAATHLAEALADRANPWVQQNRATLEETMSRVRPHVAELSVEANERDATVMINGQTAVTLPLATPLYRDPGAVTLVVRSREGEAVTRTLTLAAGGTARESVQFAGRTAPRRVPSPSPPPLPLPPPGERVEQGSTRRVLAWTTAGVAVTGFGLSLVAWRLREGTVSDYTGQCPAGEVGDAAVVTRCAGLHAQADEDVSAWGTVTAVGLVAGGVLAVTSAVLFATAPGRRTETRAVRCGSGPGVVGVGCAVAF